MRSGRRVADFEYARRRADQPTALLLEMLREVAPGRANGVFLLHTGTTVNGLQFLGAALKRLFESTLQTLALILKHFVLFDGRLPLKEGYDVEWTSALCVSVDGN